MTVSPEQKFLATIAKHLGGLVLKYIKKKKTKQQIYNAVHEAFAPPSENLLALCMDGEFSEKLFRLAGGKNTDASRLAKQAYRYADEEGLNISRIEILQELKDFGNRLTDAFSQIDPEYGQQPAVFERFYREITNLLIVEEALPRIQDWLLEKLSQHMAALIASDRRRVRPLSNAETIQLQGVPIKFMSHFLKYSMENLVTDAPHAMRLIASSEGFQNKFLKMVAGDSVESALLIDLAETQAAEMGLPVERTVLLSEITNITEALSAAFWANTSKKARVRTVFDDHLQQYRRFAPPFIVPFSQNPQLRHQDRWIDQMEELLAERQQAVINQPAALIGQGGIGKTAMAVEYAYRFAGRYPGGVHWLQMEQGLAGAAREFFAGASLCGYKTPEIEGLDEDQIGAALITFLNQPQGLKLMVLDNVEENSIPQEISMVRDAHVLVTTRRQQVSMPTVQMVMPADDEALDIFLSYAALTRSAMAPEDLAAAEKICKITGNLPLALEIIGQLSKTMHLADLAGQLPKALIGKPAPTCNKQCTTVVATLNLAGQRFSHPRTPEVLMTAAYLAPEYINRDLVGMIFKFSGSEIAEPELAEIFSNLADLSILRKSQHGYAIHRLTQEAARFLDEDEAMGQQVGQVMGGVVQAVTEQGQYQQAYFLIPHLMHLASMADETLPEDEFPSVPFVANLAIYLYYSGIYSSSSRQFRDCAERVRHSKGEEHPDYATLLNNLAGLYESQGKYEKAEPLHQRSLEIREKALGPDHPSVGTSLNNLAGLYESQGKYEKAEPLYQRSLEISEKALGPDHPDVGTSLNNLAGLYESQGKYEKAEPLYQRSLEIREKALGPDHPSVGTSLNNLAYLYKSQGKYEKAEPLYQRALKIFESALGVDHPNTVTVRKNYEIFLKEKQAKKGSSE